MLKAIDNLNLSDTYFGFASKNTIQDKRKRTVLDKQFRYNDSDSKESFYASRKEFIYIYLCKGCTIDIHENYSYYSSRIDDYTKPRTLYKLVTSNDSYFEITKTEYEYATYLIENDFLNYEKAYNFIKQEQELKQKELLLKKEREEQERKEREEQRLKEERERKERARQYNEKYHKLGKEFIKRLEYDPIKQVLDEHWEELKTMLHEEDHKKEKEIYKQFYNRFIITIGNLEYCKHTVKYFLFETEREFSLQTNISRFFEKEILFTIYNNISKEDHINTIYAKMNAIYNNKKYTSDNIKYSNFYKFNHETERFILHYGQEFNYKGFTFYLLELDNGIQAIEKTTGKLFGKGNSKNEITKRIKRTINTHRERLANILNKEIEKHGSAPKVS